METTSGYCSVCFSFKAFIVKKSKGKKEAVNTWNDTTRRVLWQNARTLITHDKYLLLACREPTKGHHKNLKLHIYLFTMCFRPFSFVKMSIINCYWAVLKGGWVNSIKRSSSPSQSRLRIYKNTESLSLHLYLPLVHTSLCQQLKVLKTQYGGKL